MPIDNDDAVIHDLAEDQGALDFVEELQVHESDWEVAANTPALCG